VGGEGSGFYYRFGSKGRAEDHLSADVRRWHRRGLLEPGASFTASWGRLQGDSSIGVLVLGTPGEPAEAVRLSYSQSLPGEEKEDVAYRVPLEWTACTFGGLGPGSCARACVAAGRRPCSTSGGATSSAASARISYASQREKGGSVPALHRCQRIRTKLGGSPNMSEPFPEKPKGMHWKTYWRHYERHEAAWSEYMAALAVEVGRLSDRLGAIVDKGS
jgi:hypothetical protein